MKDRAAEARHRDQPRTEASNDGPEQIQPVAFRPTAAAETPRFRFLVRPVRLAFLGAFIVLGLLTWFMFTARSVSVQFEPPADDVELDGFLPTFELGGRFLAQPGSYTVVANKEGYRPFEQALEIGDVQNQEYSFTLRKLPGFLSIVTAPDGATVSLAGETLGVTPLLDVELEPGDYTVALTEANHLPHEIEITIEGGSVEQELVVELTPNWAPVSLSSIPPGAVVMVDGEERGSTPLTTQIGAGKRMVHLHLEGFKTWQSELTVVAGEQMIVPEVKLQVADGIVAIRTEPSNANVTIDGSYRGRTPLDVELPPGSTYRLNINKIGYKPTSRSLTVSGRQDQSVSVRLEALLGEVRIASDPADVTIYVDERVTRTSDNTLLLSAIPHRIELRKEGYVPYQTTVTPKPGFPQEIAVILKTLEQARIEAIPELITTRTGQELVLIRPKGTFTMGASRREQGRRANESLRQVELTRPYYLSLKEVSNADIRQFDPSHSSGEVQRFDINLDDQPAVRLTWEKAARFCNWLSSKEGLPPAYVIEGQTVRAVTPLTTGYRLPTEAEWAYAARIAGHATPPKYPWGEQMPPPPQSGNFADRSATRLVDGTITQFRDGHPATSPVGVFKPNPLGIYDMGGNVAEWVHDLYAVYPDSAEEVMVDPLGPEEGLFHVIRGSSWMHGTVTELRLTYRDYGDIERPDVGFRIARYLE